MSTPNSTVLKEVSESIGDTLPFVEACLGALLVTKPANESELNAIHYSTNLLQQSRSNLLAAQRELAKQATL